MASARECQDRFIAGDRRSRVFATALDFVLFRVERIIEEFKADLYPFQRIDNYEKTDAFFTGCCWNGAHLGIDVFVEPNRYRLRFVDREDWEGKNGRARLALEKVDCLQEYRPEGGAFFREFEFPRQAGELVEYIRAFKSRLARMLESEPTTST